jgi:hypothetical protein
MSEVQLIIKSSDFPKQQLKVKLSLDTTFQDLFEFIVE